MPVTTASFRISMVSNAEHSLQRGYEMLLRSLRKDDPYLVKEALIWVHHGVELVLKQLLVDKASEYLIFEDIDKAVRKVENLRHHSGMTDAGGMQLFEHTSVRTVGYSQLLGRVSVVLDLDELSLGTSLREALEELGNVRNEIVHSPSELDIREAASLLTRIGDPLLSLIYQEAGDSGLTYGATMSIRGSLSSCKYLVTEYEPKQTESEERVLSLARKFRGQQVPATLFGQTGQFTLPDFSEAEIRRETGYHNFMIESDEVRWLVSVERGNTNKEKMLVKKQLAARSQVDQLWVAGATTHPYVYPDVLLSSQDDIERLEEILTDD